MDSHPVDYHSFLLRLWRTDSDGPWQASLEDPVTGEKVGFKTVKRLCFYLLAATSARADADTGSIPQDENESYHTHMDN